MASKDTTILCHNGTIITQIPSNTSDSYDILPLFNHSLLITNDLITEIAPSISPPSFSTKVIDCTDKIISPGFVDTHHHLWQTQLKGRHADEMLLNYMGTGNLRSFDYEPRDILWGQLAGCMEAVDAGTTTVIDHAHLAQTPEHANAGLSATIASGIRSIFCYTVPLRLKSWTPFEMNPDMLPSWLVPHLSSLTGSQPYGNGRVTIGFGFDALWLPKDIVVSTFNKVREIGIKLITTHYINTNHPMNPTSTSPIATLASYDLLNRHILFSHANSAPLTDATLLSTHGGSVSTTPSTELQMGMGHAPCFSPTFHPHSSLGVDCHSANDASIPSQMRLALQSSRAAYNERFLTQCNTPSKPNASVAQAFNLGTILGARAAGLEKQTGSLEVGKWADVVVLDGTTPGMVCAALQDPVAAVVLHSCVRDVEVVIVGGEIRKEGGRLMDVSVNAKEAGLEGKDGTVSLGWRDVVRAVLESRDRIDEKVKDVDFEAVKKVVKGVFHVGEDAIVEDDGSLGRLV